MNAYQESLKIKRDNYSALESAELRGEQRGIEIGAEQEKREMAREMLAGGEPLEKIARYSKLSITEIQALV